MGEGKGRRRRRVIVSGLVWLAVAAPATAMAEEPVFAENLARVLGYSLGAMAGCGLTSDEAVELTKDLHFGLAQVVTAPEQLAKAENALVQSFPYGRVDVRDGRLTCDVVHSRLQRIIDAVAPASIQ